MPSFKQVKNKVKKKKISFNKIKESPYSVWDTAINPRHFIWEIYKQPCASLTDERVYLYGVIDFLEKHGSIIEEFITIEDAQDTNLVDDDDVIMFAGRQSEAKTYLYKDNLINVSIEDDKTCGLTFYKPVNAQFVQKEFSKWIIVPKGDSKVSVLISRGGGMSTSKVTFAPPSIPDLELNYGTGFNKIHTSIVEKLNARNGKMFILSGCPGSGKSTYIKYLTSIINREFIFIPVNMSDRLSSPEFITLLMGKKEAVLILEDAEKAVQQRGGYGDDSTVATLLNLSDGILGSLLNISIIVTFNASKQTIDSALLRKGRLAFEYDFGPLNVTDAQRLADSLKKTIKIEKPTPLCDIYGIGDITHAENPSSESSEKSSADKEMGFHTLITPKINSKEEKVTS